MTSTAPQIVVHTVFPQGGLSELLEQPMTPLDNIGHVQQVLPGGFTPMGLCMAPNARAFVRALGKPLALAHDLESRPGVWVLGTTTTTHEWLIFTDMHRQNGWKGGQVCALQKDSSISALVDSAQALSAALGQWWGEPPPGLGLMDWDDWFDDRHDKLDGVCMPRLTPVRSQRPKFRTSPR